MCGRYTLVSPVEAVQSLFDLPGSLSALHPRFNMAPTQDGPVVRVRAETGEREFSVMRWGLLPPFASDLSFGSRLINARSETAAVKPSFRRAFRKQRCLVVADGFYEWKAEGGVKRPHHFTLRDGGPFGMAGLWESWRPSEDADQVESFTILTCDANADVGPIHHRMPVILKPESFSLWLGEGPVAVSGEELQAILRPFPDGGIATREVSTRVNSPAHDDPDCLQSATGIE